LLHSTLISGERDAVLVDTFITIDIGDHFLSVAPGGKSLVMTAT
jgi:hypothetical protein